MLQNSRRPEGGYLQNNLVLLALFILAIFATQALEFLIVEKKIISFGVGVSGWTRIETLFWSAKTLFFIIAGSIAVATVARTVARFSGVSSAEQNKVFWGFFFASPWLIGFFLFVLGPSLASLFYSLMKGYKLGDSLEISGFQSFVDKINFENYRKLLAGEGAHGRRFHQAMFNSFYYAIVGVPLQIFAALMMAVLLNQTLKGIKAFRLIFYMPVILAGGPAILLAWRYMLQSNGGFVNVAARGLADDFFLFDWTYRGFIFSVEGFNGFFAGLTRGDPVGPFKYVIPAVIGFLVLLTLAFGDWDVIKRRRAQRTAEVICIIVAAVLVTRGLSAEVINISWLLAVGALVIGGIVLNTHLGKMGTVRIWQYGTLFFFILVSGLLLLRPWDDRVRYLGLILLILAPVVYSLIGKWGRQKQTILIGVAAVFLAIVFVRLLPGQIDGGRPIVLVKYVVMSSALEEPGNEDYLSNFPAESFSSLWIYGTVIAVLAGAVILDEKRPQVRRYLLYGATVFFALFLIGSFIDGTRYFSAFETIAQESGSRNYHFALFRSATDSFPSQNRVPLWMSDERWTKSSLVLITMWSSGAGMLIFLAALKGVPNSLYEAAEVDGANRLQKFFKITLPMISPAMFYNVVIGMIAALQTFEAVYILRTPENTDGIASAAYYLYERTFRQLAIGEGSAMSWILAAIIVTMTVMQFRYSDWVHYEA